MPDIQYNQGLAISNEEKAAALRQRFYPIVQANLEDIQDCNPQEQVVELLLDQEATQEEIQQILSKVKPDKSPGADGIPYRILKAMGQPLVIILAQLITSCWKLEYFPQQFKHANTIVLQKPNKEDYSLPGAWRPIALLNTIGKIMEKLAAQRLSKLAEQYHLLPNTQMGNRPQRSTITAVELLVEQIYTVWNSGKNLASVLSLDISGAFDTVNHQRLLDNLRKKGIPKWFTHLIQSFLTNRTTSLIIEGQSTQLHHLQAGVPQGSPLSPILFLFYNGPLLESLQLPDQRITPIGFADDINLLAYGPSTQLNCQALQLAHEKCLQWANTHGMKFAPDKYTLTHFTKRRTFDTTTPVQIGSTNIYPSPTTKVLGLLLDSKLNWKQQIQAVKKKMTTQIYALTRTTASTYGITLSMARQVYIAVIRPAIGYGSPIWHTPTSNLKPKGPITNIQSQQNQCLRRVLGAYKATPIRQLETEAWVPPLDIWLNGGTAQFQKQLITSSINTQIQEACDIIKSKLKYRSLRQRIRPSTIIRTTKGEERRRWVEKWLQLSNPSNSLQAQNQNQNQDNSKWSKNTIKKRVLQEWRERWDKGRTIEGRLQIANNQDWIPEDTPPNKKILSLHKDLRKAESSILIQARTGKIGLNKFLYQRRVPEYYTAQCQCQGGEETVRHLVLYCPRQRNRREGLLINGYMDYRQLIGTSKGAQALSKWLIQSGRLGQYSLAKQLLFD
jgi:retron-type reverse transcriptase